MRNLTRGGYLLMVTLLIAIGASCASYHRELAGAAGAGVKDRADRPDDHPNDEDHNGDDYHDGR